MTAGDVAVACVAPVVVALTALVSRLALLRFLAVQLRHCPPELRHDICARLVAASAAPERKNESTDKSVNVPLSGQGG